MNRRPGVHLASTTQACEASRKKDLLAPPANADGGETSVQCAPPSVVRLGCPLQLGSAQPSVAVIMDTGANGPAGRETMVGFADPVGPTEPREYRRPATRTTARNIATNSAVHRKDGVRNRRVRVPPTGSELMTRERRSSAGTSTSSASCILLRMSSSIR